jgi:gamma-glutamyltranspeptidase / glutathione hydrolase
VPFQRFPPAASTTRSTPPARLLLKDGALPKPGDTYRNLDLAAMLETLADAGSVAPFYRGGIARAIAAAFRKNGGLVTEKDLNNYRAREVTPLEFSWRGYSVRTAPLTAGGPTVLQALAILDPAGRTPPVPASDRCTTCVRPSC